MALQSRRSFLQLTGIAAVPAVVGGGWLMSSAAADTKQAATTPAAATPAAFRDFDRYVRELADADKFSGTVLVSRNGRQVLSRAYGYADRKKQVRNQAGTIYCLASVTKLFTAVAVGQLVQRGALNLLDPIGKYLTGFTADVADHVTVHQLLTHTSGLGDFMRDPGYFEEAAKWTSGQQMMDGTLQFARGEKLAFVPGSGSQYSNSGYHTLGCIVAKVAGKTYYEYVRNHIFRPAGMSTADFTTMPQWRSGSQYAHPYPADQSGKRSDALDGNIFAFIGNPAGNAMASANDMVRFAQAVNDGTLLNAEYKEIFLSPKVPKPPRAGAQESAAFAAYATDDLLVNGKWVYGHPGGAPGVSTSVEWYPGTGWTAVCLSNYDSSLAVNQRLREILTS
ncbi:serine hydrolase domain-containing protein [Kribbella solani]|uniref:CubicO group peptidase (Beta-lactamase class C family) n=1 Tax=Kribbella solani TaxID=236067 RepID=A0A841E0G5_9ACTN|nr:serine hydrolase domain-containing protein [Kribbella solani]MBB5983929.1 CubicO group peptidase (beta-lactamase class C family) [Kribbella solani]